MWITKEENSSQFSSNAVENDGKAVPILLSVLDERYSLKWDNRLQEGWRGSDQGWHELPENMFTMHL